MECEITSNPERSIWSGFLDRQVSGNLQQSFEYGEVVEASEARTAVVRLLAMCKNEPAGIVQGEYRKRFGFGEKVEVGGVYGFGPVVGAIEEKQSILKDLGLALEKYATKNRIAQAFIHQPEASPILQSLGYGLSRVFNVYKVRLNMSPKELWKSISHNKRKNIQKAEAEKVQVIEGKTHDDFISFYQLLDISGKRAGFEPPTFDLLNAYFKVFGAAKKMKIFLAIFKDQPVAGVFVVIHGNVAYALGAGSREEVWQVRPNDILHWKAMEWGCNKGLAYYHMGYVPNPIPTEGSELWGLWRWKREWNGELSNIFLYHKIYMPRFRKFILAPYLKISPVVQRTGAR